MRTITFGAIAMALLLGAAAVAEPTSSPEGGALPRRPVIGVPVRPPVRPVGVVVRPPVKPPVVGIVVRPPVRPPVVGIVLPPRPIGIVLPPRPIGIVLPPRPPRPIGIVLPPRPPRPIGIIIPRPPRPCPPFPRPFCPVCPGPVGVGPEYPMPGTGPVEPVEPQAGRPEVFGLSCTAIDPQQIREIAATSMTLAVANDRDLGVAGVVALADNTEPSFSTMATGTFNPEEISLRLGDAGDLNLRGQQDQDGSTFYTGSVMLLGKQDEGNLRCVVQKLE